MSTSTHLALNGHLVTTEEPHDDGNKDQCGRTKSKREEDGLPGQFHGAGEI
jgi:hypothetical protein